ncbi:MAG TPA: hypothetical protein VML19_18140 [Verrucomicrobiae bacterium]|nr:hypothetical protein [Verrucomicrobiae bacterium]
MPERGAPFAAAAPAARPAKWDLAIRSVARHPTWTLAILPVVASIRIAATYTVFNHTIDLPGHVGQRYGMAGYGHVPLRTGAAAAGARRGSVGAVPGWSAPRRTGQHGFPHIEPMDPEPPSPGWKAASETMMKANRLGLGDDASDVQLWTDRTAPTERPAIRRIFGISRPIGGGR